MIATPEAHYRYEVKVNGKHLDACATKLYARMIIKADIRRRRKLAKAPRGVIEKWTVSRPGKE